MDQFDPQWLRAEVDRHWMRAPTAASVALALITAKDCHNWADRKLLDFVEVESSSYGARRFSLGSVLQLTIIAQLRHGSSLVIGGAVASIALNRMRERAALGYEYVVSEDPEDPSFLVYSIEPMRERVELGPEYVVSEDPEDPPFSIYSIGPKLAIEFAFVRPADIAAEMLADPHYPPASGIPGPGGALREQRVLSLDGIIAAQFREYLAGFESLERYEVRHGEEPEA